MKKAHLVQLLLFILFYSCKSSVDDPFQKIEFDSQDLDNTISNLIQANVIQEKGRYFYPYTFQTDSLKLPFSVTFNPDDYNVSGLRQIKIYIKSDTLFNPEPIYMPGQGPVEKKIVDHINKTYIGWYGDPDTIIYPKYESHTLTAEMEEWFSKLNAARDSKLSEYEKKKRDENKEKILVWNENNFDVVIYIPKYEDNKFTDYKASYNGASIIYSIKNYEKRLETIKDSIRKTLKAPDIVELSIKNPIWKDEGYSTKFTYDIDGIYRTDLGGKLLNKTILAVKYDVVIKNLYDDEIARFPDASFELSNPMEAGGLGFQNPYRSGIIYSNNFVKANQYNSARRQSENGSIKIKAEIKAVVFKGGEVLKK